MNKKREIIREVVYIFLNKRITRAAAQLSYSLTLSLFPLLICVIAMLSRMHFNVLDVTQFSGGIVPTATVQVVNDYVDYVTSNFNSGMLIVALLLLATTSSAGFRAVLLIMAEIEGEARYKGFWPAVLSFVFSFVFLAAIYLAVIVMLTGNWFIERAAIVLQIEDVDTGIWNWIRFILLFAILVTIIYGIYRITAPKERPRKQRIIGALISAFTLVIVSIVSSWTFMMSTKYSLIYGSLASFIILMVWFFICGNVLISGNVINYVINRHCAYFVRRQKSNQFPGVFRKD